VTPEQLQAAFETRLAESPDRAPVVAAREAALAAFAAQGFPTRKLEAWRYTDLKPITEADFELFPSMPAEADTDAHLRTAGIDLDCPALVFVDGHLMAERACEKLGERIELSRLSDTVDTLGPLIDTETLGSEPLAALNLAFSDQGARIRIPAGTQICEPIHLLFVSRSEQRQAYQPQIAIELGANTQAEIALHFIGSPQSSSWVNAVTRIALDTGARLVLNRIQDDGAGQFHTELTDAELAADATLRITTIELGGALVRSDIRVRLAGPGANCELTGLLLCAEDQHIDNHVSVEHLAAHTTSEQRFRSIIGERGRGVFSGKVAVHKGTRAISANQASDNLLLADTAEINTKPELEIYADDVKCSHGATIGELDDSHLFYLRSRGITESAARGLLTLAFASALLGESPWPGIDERIVEKFGLTLPDDIDRNPRP